MNLSEDQIIEKYGKKWGNSLRNTLLPYENEFTRVSCRYNVIKRKQKVSKKQQDQK